MSKKRKGFDVERDSMISIDSFPPEAAERYVLEMRVSLLLRDACPTWFEIEGEKDQAKRRANERARDIATDALMKLYRDAEKQGRMNNLDCRIRFFCDRLKVRNDGRLPAPKGGRPLDENRYFQIAFYVAEKAKELGGDHGCLETALKDAADHFHQAYSTVRDIYYDSCAVEDWERAVKAERVWRAWRACSAL